MARRSSARLAAATPKRVPLSHDARTLPRLNESTGDNDDMPGAFPRSASPPATKRMRVRAATPERKVGSAVQKASAREEEEEEEEVQWEKSERMLPRTEPAKKSVGLSLIGTLPATPTRIAPASERKEWRDAAAAEAASEEEKSTYQFTFRHREHSLELSPEAKK